MHHLTSREKALTAASTGSCAGAGDGCMLSDCCMLLESEPLTAATSVKRLSATMLERADPTLMPHLRCHPHPPIATASSSTTPPPTAPPITTADAPSFEAAKAGRRAGDDAVRRHVKLPAVSVHDASAA
eukprot:308156-Rhodomonas_salina.1